MPKRSEKISGIVERITFFNEENGYSVIKLRLNSGRITTVVGQLDRRRPGEFLKLVGIWTLNPQYGKQFEADTVEVGTPPDDESLRRYLASDIIDGIGPEMARRLVEQFGDNVIQVVREQPHRLTEVQGIGKKRAAAIRKSILGEDRERRTIRELSTRLMAFGIGPGKIRKIYKAYGDSALDLLHRDPYRLVDEIGGFGFLTADRIASKFDIAPDSDSRLRAGVLYCLDRAQEEGHCYLPKSELFERAIKILNVDRDKIVSMFDKLRSSEELIDDDRKVYPARFFALETEVARRIVGLSRTRPTGIEAKKMNRDLKIAQREMGIEFTPEQHRAVHKILAEESVLILTGGPGTGKTTIIGAVVKVAELSGLELALCAPTGRASKRLSEAVGKPASTIHRLLSFRPDEVAELSVRQLDIDLLVVDEMSMVDLELFWVLLSAIRPGCRLLIVGDADQLPSVGPGQVLRDLIDSEKLPLERLSVIHRQAARSRIIMESHNILHGQVPVTRNNPKSDFFFINEPDRELGLRTIVDLVSRRLPEAYNLDPRRDIQVIVPMYKGICGANALNESIRAVLNPQKPVQPFSFALGDKVMQLKNNYDLGVFNGDIGIVQKIDDEKEKMTVLFDAPIIYDIESTRQLTLAYAITVHKSQGSEVPCIVLPLYTEHFILLRRRLLYTAITRAKRLCVLVGQTKALGIAVGKGFDEERYTGLEAKIREAASGQGLLDGLD